MRYVPHESLPYEPLPYEPPIDFSDSPANSETVGAQYVYG